MLMPLYNMQHEYGTSYSFVDWHRTVRTFLSLSASRVHSLRTLAYEHASLIVHAR